MVLFSILTALQTTTEIQNLAFYKYTFLNRHTKLLIRARMGKLAGHVKHPVKRSGLFKSKIDGEENQQQNCVVTSLQRKVLSTRGT